MKERGIYTGIVAFAFLVLVGSTVIYLQASNSISASDSVAGKANAVKLVLENAAIVADKAAAKGIQDGLNLVSCTDDGAYGISSRVDTALLEITNKTGINCTANEINDAQKSGSMQLECRSADGSVVYSKSVLYSKTVSIQMVDTDGDLVLDTCQYSITDAYSDLWELP